jgi:hypothetical protein
MCLAWQQWTETSVQFDDIGILAFHSCIVVDLWQSLSEWHLLLSECILVCCRKNVGAQVRPMYKQKILIKLGMIGSEIREMLVQVYVDNAMKKTAFYKWVTSFSEGKESVTDEERSGQPATSRNEVSQMKLVKLCVKIIGCQVHIRAREHQERNS